MIDGFDRRGAPPSFQQFAESVGDRFRVDADRRTVELTLLEAMALPAGTNLRRAVPFSIVFRGPTDDWLAQRIYAFEHDALGIFEMFIVPIGPDVHGPRYEAIFN